MPYDLLLNRSVDFAPFFDALQIVYGGGHDIQLVLGLTQMLWDRTEPMGYAPYVAEDMLPGTPAHQILIHAAIGDHQVTPLGAHMVARARRRRTSSPSTALFSGSRTRTRRSPARASSSGASASPRRR